MIGAFVLTAKMKALLAAFSLLLLGGGIYEITDNNQEFSPATEIKDPYTFYIQERAQLIENTIIGVIDAQGKEETWQFQATCEDASAYIRKASLEAQQEDTTLTADQRELNQAYRAYLNEALKVVITCYNGEDPDLTAMNEAKEKLKN